jgi:signal transduction histidine kinase
VEQQLIQPQAQLQALTAALLQAEEQERRRIGQGLHDHIGQILALAKGKLVALPDAALDDNVRDALEEIQNLINQAIKSIRSLTFELSSPVLYELGLNAALHSLGDSLAQEHGFRFQLKSKKHAQPLGEDARFTLYGFAREFLFNVVKHARAQNVTLTVVRETVQLRLTLEDDGMGFDATGAGESFDEQRGFGLFSIRQQLNHIGGSFTVESAPGRGTRIVVTVPLDESLAPGFEG